MLSLEVVWIVFSDHMSFSYDWQTKALCALYPLLSSQCFCLTISPLLSSLYHTPAHSSKQLYANTKSHNALYCLVLTFEYLNGVF